MNITISDGATTIAMPMTKDVVDVGKMEYKEQSTANGRTVRKLIGFRPGFKYQWDYVPIATITALNAMLRAGTFFTVTYFDTDSTAQSGTFSVSYPAPTLFGYVDGAAVFHKFELTIAAQEVS